MPILLFILIAALPSYLIRFSIGGVPVTLLEILFLVVIGVWVWRGGVKRILRERDFRIWLVLGLAWMFIGTIQMFVSPNLRAAAGIWKAYIIEPTILFFVFLDVLREERARQWVWRGLAILGFVLGLILAFQWFTGIGIAPPWDHLAPRRATGLFGYPNANGLLLAPIAVLLFGLSLFEKNLRRAERIWFVVCAFAAAAGVWFAHSVGGLVGIFAGALILLIIPRRTRWASGLFGLTAILTGAFWPALRQEIFMRDWSGVVRLGQWQETLAMLKDHWLFGAGLAGYQSVFPAYHTRTYIEVFLYPHNIFLNFWSEMGLVGLVLFLMIVGLAVYPHETKTNNPLTSPLYKGERGSYYQLPAMSALLTLLTHGLVDVPYFKNDLAILFWLILAFIIVFSRGAARQYEKIMP